MSMTRKSRGFVWEDAVADNDSFLQKSIFKTIHTAKILMTKNTASYGIWLVGDRL